MSVCMKSKKIYFQINWLESLKKILDFIDDKNDIKFNTSLEEKIFEKSLSYLDIDGQDKIEWFVIWNEFCEHLYTKIDELPEIISIIPKNYNIIIQTSLLTLFNKKYYLKLFILLKKLTINYKLIVNDIGFISLLKSLHIKNVEIIIWRLILKPRKVFNIKNKTKHKYDDQSINLKEFNNFFDDNSISSFWIDILPQWTRVDSIKNKYLYFPWWYYTSSRGCVTKSTLLKKSHIFPQKYCDRACQNSYIEFSENSQFIWKWNLVFYNSLDYIKKSDFNKFEYFIFQPFFPL